MLRRRIRSVVSLFGFVLFVAAIPIFLVCCSPQWTPDGNRFIYVTATGVRLFDLKEGASQQIAKAAFPTAGAAVWPTGERVVVARVTTTEPHPELRITVYDLAGKLLHESPVIRIEEKPEGMFKFFPVQVYAAEDKKHVLAFIATLKTAVVYDVDGKSARLIRNVQPLAWVFQENRPSFTEVSPLTPDGKGFLAVNPSKTESVAHYLWDDDEPKRFEASAEFDRVIGRVREEGKEFGVARSLQWDMGVLTARVGDGVVAINPRNRTITYSDQQGSAELAAHAKRHGVYVLCELADGALIQVTSEHEIQLWHTADGGRAVALVTAGKDSFINIAPSHDRRCAIVRILGDAGRIIVVDVTGNKLADFSDSPVPGG